MQKIVAKFYSQTWLPKEAWKLNHDGGKEWWHWMTIWVPLKNHRNYNKVFLSLLLRFYPIIGTTRYIFSDNCWRKQQWEQFYWR